MVTIKCEALTEEIKEVAKMIAENQSTVVVVVTPSGRYEVNKHVVKKAPKEGETQPH